ncbi:MAG TPA: serine hydrolase domain-containing protein, partial [Bacteroidales bacterium]|nr:serine hydrolase domain-containing protein [Bacteroidales bacterium]
MVARHGKVVHCEKYGWMDVDKPMQLNTIFRMASMTKPVTSVAVMMLYEEGYFQMDDPVADYIPEFKDLKVFSSIDKDGIHTVDQIRPMTIRDLLTHTSGLTGVGADSPVDSMYREANLSEGTLKDMIQKLSKIPLLYQPGTRWNYSRSSDVLAYLVEVISGKPFDVFLKERIFNPLKMKDTDFYVPKEKIERVVAVYAPDSIGIKVIMKPDTSISIPVKFLSGNGGLVSTATDYMIFSQMLLNKGEYNGVRLLGSKTVDLMTSNQLSNEIMPNDDFFGPLLSGMGFGFGFAVLQDNIQSKIIGSKGSYWWSGSGNTYFYIDPKEELVLILMTQFVPNFYYPVYKQF